MPFSRSHFHPALVDRDWWDGWDFPSRIRRSNVGHGLLSDDFLQPIPQRSHYYNERKPTDRQVSVRGSSQVQNDKDKFQITLDVSHFKPEELCVKTVDNCIIIHGKHEEKEDEHGFVQREFKRRYVLPEDIEPEKVTSSLSPDGYLIVEATRPRPEVPKPNERNVPITIRADSILSEKSNITDVSTDSSAK